MGKERPLLSFTSLREAQSEKFSHILDRRTRIPDHSIHDVLMSGFAMMMLQDPSLLQFMKRMGTSVGQANLRALFGVESIPSDTRMSEIIDRVEPDSITPMLDEILARLGRTKHLQEFAFLDDHYIVAIDGSQYFSSKKICCPGCLIRTASEGETWYSHAIVQAAILKPGMSQVIPLVPEEIRNTDGSEKQDCEVNATKRLIARFIEKHSRMKVIWTGDSLLSQAPLIRLITSHNLFRYVLTAKPGDHKSLFADIAGMRKGNLLQSHSSRDQKGRLHRYRWTNEIALNGKDDSPIVNFVEYELCNKEGKATYTSSWVTDIAIDQANVSKIVEIGRTRWKIENECFNTLKNQGYHIEHNYGHGKLYLSFNFFLLNLLAFTFHQAFELADRDYQSLRISFGSKKNLWDHIRAGLFFLPFSDWQELIDRMVEGTRKTARGS